VQVKDGLAAKHGEYELVLTNPAFGKKSSYNPGAACAVLQRVGVTAELGRMRLWTASIARTRRWLPEQ